MKKFTIIAVLAVFIWACGGGDTDNSSSSRSGVKKEAVIDFAEVSSGEINGAVIYKNNCIACHLATGEGGISGSKDLRESKLSAVERAEVVYNGREGTAMVSYKTMLEPEEIKAVAEYTLKFK